jgi:hypothetical protein
MKANFLSFPFIYFSESELFNRLQPIQIKKTFPISNQIAHVVTVNYSHVRVGGPGGDLQFIARISIFANMKALIFDSRPADRRSEGRSSLRQTALPRRRLAEPGQGGRAAFGPPCLSPKQPAEQSFAIRASP